MRLTVRVEAADDLDAIFGWIANDSPRAARAIVTRIGERIDQLLTPGLAHMGRPGRDEGTRELVVGRYIVVYEVDEDRDERS